MSHYYSDSGIILLQGDTRERLKELPGESFNMCVTSPPYFGLRDYGTGTWEGGDEGCDHANDAALAERLRQKKSMIAVGERIDGSTRARMHDEEIGNTVQHRSSCPKCGAVRIDAQIGLESTPDEYVSNMIGVFREVRRCLRDDGVLFLNIGDSYNGSGKGGNPEDSPHQFQKQNVGSLTGAKLRAGYAVLKPKDLIGIPWMLAFALRADGWYLRQDIIWNKPNPMPESVTDRCTKAHEYIFLLSKSERYFCDMDAIAEKAVTSDDLVRDRETTKLNNTPGRKRMSGLTTNRYEMRNKRSVWTVTTKPYAAAHFATFPEDLIKPCILAGSPAGGSVLEPFCGSGTTLKVSRDLGRRATGIELNEAYCKLVTNRLAQGVLFGSEASKKPVCEK